MEENKKLSTEDTKQVSGGLLDGEKGPLQLASSKLSGKPKPGPGGPKARALAEDLASGLADDNLASNNGN